MWILKMYKKHFLKFSVVFYYSYTIGYTLFLPKAFKKEFQPEELLYNQIKLLLTVPAQFQGDKDK